MNFIAEPITSTNGKLLGVELQIRIEEKGQVLLHPELVIKDWSMEERKTFLYELLTSITKQAPFFLKRGLFCSLALADEETALLLSYDTALRMVLNTLPFVKLELTERIGSLAGELTCIRNSIWLSDLGKGDATTSLLTNGRYEVVKLDRSFFYEEIEKPTFSVLIKNLHQYCERIIVKGVNDRRHIPVLTEAGIYGIQGLYRSVPLSKVHHLM
ncbi:EAL domain-containing protein [Enterobacter sp. R1(2018)]|uniref:EAL domain-containing protein n=1 Tax=Enterobacter sp. R1(2018) TaxID=2447891 RepID=UPI001603F698|nr:EAL domain-containing protein [Enterobacter sp. R1(2018)]